MLMKGYVRLPNGEESQTGSGKGLGGARNREILPLILSFQYIGWGISSRYTIYGKVPSRQIE